MSTYTFKGKNVSPLDVVNALGIMGLTGQPSIVDDTDSDKKPIVKIDFPGATLSASQRLGLEEIAKKMGWGEGDPPPLTEEVGLLDSLTEVIVNEVNLVITEAGLPEMSAARKASLQSNLKKLASRGRIS